MLFCIILCVRAMAVYFSGRSLAGAHFAPLFFHSSPSSVMSSIANSLDLLKIVKFKPQNAGELFIKVDRFARHPGVWPYMLSSLIGITVIKSLSVGASGTSVSSQPLFNVADSMNYAAV
jgi:hypothetical protein